MGAWDGGDCAGGRGRGGGLLIVGLECHRLGFSYIAVTTLHTYVEKMGF